jgi:hypothetical protein
MPLSSFGKHASGRQLSSDTAAYELRNVMRLQNVARQQVDAQILALTLIVGAAKEVGLARSSTTGVEIHSELCRRSGRPT